MATELKPNPVTPTITADGDYFVSVRNNKPQAVSINFSTPGTGGTITIKDSQGNAYRNDADDADLAVSGGASPSTITKHEVTPTGGHINFEAASFGGSPVAEITVNPID